MPCYMDCEKPEKENQESTKSYVDPDDLDDQSYGVILLLLDFNFSIQR